MRSAARACRAAFGALLGLAAAGALDAQEGPSPLLPAEHWAVRAAWRAEALGLAPSFFPAERGVPRGAVAAALDEAAGAASGTPFEALAAGWLASFREEFAEYRPAAGDESRARAGVTAAAGAGSWTGRVAPAEGLWGSRADPARLPDRSGARLRADGTAGWDRRLSVHADAGLLGERVRVSAWEAAASLGPLVLSAGRTEAGYGPARGGGIVLSPPEPIGRIAAATRRPVVLPLLGEATAQTFLARMDQGRHPSGPWLWGARGAVRPHPRLALGMNRAAIFGGDGAGVTPRRLAGMLVGVLSESFENQIVSVDARWRLPTDRSLPAVAYAEWAAEDGAGAWWAQPAVTVGVFLPALPGAPWLAAGVEGTRFAECCGHGTWYTHSVFTGNWARGDALLGHPLGGEGEEAALYLDAAPPRLPLRLQGRLFVRSRSARTGEIEGTGNLLAPTAGGRGVGGEATVLFGLGRGATFAASYARDGGGGVRERRAEAEIRYHF